MEESQELCLSSFGGVVQKPLCNMLRIKKLDRTVASTAVPLCKARLRSCKYLLTASCSYCTSL